MALPRIEAPKYSVKIPSTGKTFQYRPYLVGEEKILMIAMESENQAQILQAIKDVVKACTFDKIEPDKLCTFDLEYLFLKLRAKSVGEISKVGLKCEKCEKATTVDVNLDEIAVKTDDLPDSKIKLTETIGVTMTWPKVKLIDQLEGANKDSKLNNITDIVLSCIDNIFDDKKVYPADEQTREELVQFLDSLNQSQFAKIQEYIEKMPKLEHTIEFDCTNKDCKHHNVLTISGMASFFA